MGIEWCPLSRLSAILRQRRVDALFADAEVIRDYLEGPERTEQAELLIREAMYKRAVARLTHEEAYRVFSILSFAMPSDSD